MRRLSRSRALWAVPVLVLAVMAAVMAASGVAASTGKSYWASISPSSAAAGAQQTFTYTVTDKDAQQALGSFRIAIPSAGWSVTAASIASAPKGASSWSVTPNPNQLGYIEAKANDNASRLGKEQSVLVSFTVAAVPCGGGVFQSVAHQANQFQGPNNEFALTNPDSARTVTTAGAPDHFTISTAPISPATSYRAGEAFSVTVRALDFCNNPVTAYTGSHGNLDGLLTSPAPVSKTPDGQGALIFANGVATTTVTTYRKGAQALTYADGVSTSTPSLNVAPGAALGGFDWTTQPGSSYTAGGTITAALTAYDNWSNVKDDYTGSHGSLTGLGTSPAPVSRGPSGLGAQTFTSGVASVSAIDYLAETTHFAFSADTKSAPSSNSFTVAPDTFVLSFTTQPGAALPTMAIPGTTAGSSPTVRVADQYANPAPNGTQITVSAATSPGGTSTAFSAGTNPRGVSGGSATFDDLKIGTLGTYKLTASFSGSISAVSNAFSIVSVLSNCSGTTCEDVIGNDKQTTYGKITRTDATFADVVLTSTFLPSGASQCGAFSSIPGTNVTDVSVFGNVSASKPSFSVLLITPKSTLQAAGFTQRSASSFNVCVGVKRLDNGDPTQWKTKNGTPKPATDADGFAWGIAPDCTQNGLVAGNPCVRLKTKQLNDVLAYTGGSLPAGVTFSNSDLALVLEMGYPFDLRASTGG